jgi:hypothetical protein
LANGNAQQSIFIQNVQKEVLNISKKTASNSSEKIKEG